jgi:chromosome segregation ATPase
MQPDVKQSLQQLQAKLQDIRTDDSAAQSRLDALAQDVQQAIDLTDDHPTLGERLEQSFILFEDDHPDVAAAIRTVINTLSGSGV